MGNIQRYLITGILTIIPVWITWLVFEFLLEQLIRLGKPGVLTLSKALQTQYPALSQLMQEPWVYSIFAIILTLLMVYLLGWITSKVMGRRILALFDQLMHRIPLVQTVYGAVRKLIGVLQSKPENIQRVVLIAFPNPGMRTVGFVTKVLEDELTGEKLAAVYVPTTPNPTSGYMEIVPLEDLISTDWSMDEAMTFILSAGAVSPDRICYRQAKKT